MRHCFANRSSGHLTHPRLHTEVCGREKLGPSGMFFVPHWISSARRQRMHSPFCEAVAVVNSRPTTPLIVGAHDLEALTPDYLLRVGEGHGSLPLGEAQNKECHHRRWNTCTVSGKSALELKEYFPLLRQRIRNVQTRKTF